MVGGVGCGAVHGVGGEEDNVPGVGFAGNGGGDIDVLFDLSCSVARSFEIAEFVRAGHDVQAAVCHGGLVDGDNCLDVVVDLVGEGRGGAYVLMPGEGNVATGDFEVDLIYVCLLYTSPSPRDLSTSRMPSSA